MFKNVYIMEERTMISGIAGCFYDVLWNGELWLNFYGTHGQEFSGSVNNDYIPLKDEELLDFFWYQADRIGMGERWFIHPCHPYWVKKKYPNLSSHILGGWLGETGHLVLGETYVVGEWDAMNSLKHTPLPWETILEIAKSKEKGRWPWKGMML